MTTPIPTPPGLPLIGNAFDLNSENQSQSLAHLADIYGPIYELRLPGKNWIIISNYALFDEICDEKRFSKAVSGASQELRHAIHDGLFTAHSDEHAWGVAHRILVPAFGPLALRDMFDEMHEIATQLVLKWARYGPEHRIDVTDDFTRLTLDSIALCAMETRFNSFYREAMHPFVQAMSSTLLEAGRRSIRPFFMKSLMRGSEREFQENIKIMQKIALDIVNVQRSHPNNKKSLINSMLNGIDPKTGEKMTDDNVADNMITFLIAGHETTSGFLSFLFYNLLNNPETFHEAQNEVDEVIGKDPITVDHMAKLPYVTACLRETLRLTPTIPGTTIAPRPESKEDPILLGGGKYMVPRDRVFSYILNRVHKDPEVYGEDAELFRPDRMLDENFNKLPKNAWKPFGNGVRACIGRGFAWQEAMLATTMLLQVFDFRFADPNYKLGIKQTLTIKPKDLFMHASLRKGIDPLHLESMLSGGSSGAKEFQETPKKGEEVDKSTTRQMSIFFGGNMGTCESLAQTAAQSAVRHGFSTIVKPLDDATDNLPKDQLVLIITASYEGEPPDNAGRFIAWLKKSEASDLSHVQYAVFGCGNRDWKETFQRIPTLTDTQLEKRKAIRLAVRGSADAANNDVFSDFEKWEDQVFWPAVKGRFGDGAGADEPARLDVDVSTTLRSSHLRADVKEAIVIKNENLTEGTGVDKRHLELQLPTDMTYKAGDYLAILPINHQSTIARVIKRFSLPWDAFLTVKFGETTLPKNTPLSVYDVLAGYVELNQVATKRNIETIIASTSDESLKTTLAELKDKFYSSEIKEKYVSPLDLLEKHLSIDMPFGEFLAMLPQLRLRQYSISSSPFAGANTCTLTCRVLDEESFQGGKRHLGVASNFLSRLRPGDHIHVNVKPSHHSFHLPLDIGGTPLIMICAGTGIAPFRGFLQERAIQIEAGRELAPALLFMGCRQPHVDDLYREQLEDWSSKGAIDVRYAYSKDPGSSNGAKYVQDRFWDDRKDVMDAYGKGAKIFVCGSGKVADGVREMSKKMYMENQEQKGTPKSEEEAEAWFAGLRNERFMSDIFD